MSNTPRTDALLLEIHEGRTYENNGPMADHARQLERDLEQVRAELMDTKALLSAASQDFTDMRGRFCEHHGTPGGCSPGCPVCMAQSAESLLSTAQDTIQVLTQRAEAAEAKLKEAK